jgi:hypothetical protein
VLLVVADVMVSGVCWGRRAKGAREFLDERGDLDVFKHRVDSPLKLFAYACAERALARASV